MEIVSIRRALDVPNPVWAFELEGAGGASARVIVVDRPTKRIVCIPVSHGCHHACMFCSSARRPFGRMFAAVEMLRMARLVVQSDALPAENQPVLVSLMGVGEPLDNPYVPAFLRSVSRLFRTALATTVPRMEDLLDLMRACPDTKVLVSLHAGLHPTRRVVLGRRSALSPRALYLALGDSVEYNYVVVDSVNDSESQVHALNAIVGTGKMRLKINTLNKWPGLWRREGTLPVHLFQRNIEVEHYSTDGAEIFGACGQCGYKERV